MLKARLIKIVQLCWVYYLNYKGNPLNYKLVWGRKNLKLNQSDFDITNFKIKKKQLKW